MATTDDIRELVKSTLAEVERLLSTKAVVGEPMTVEGNVIIPLIAIGFGFGGGGVSGRGMQRGEGGGSGVGGGGIVKPVGVVVVNKDGVKVEPTHGVIVPIADRFMDLASRFVERRFPAPEKAPPNPPESE
jgi:uncharacterized spore protein YtfJ